MIKNINNVPTSNRYIHHSCDYIELLSLINNNDIIALSNILDRFYDDEKILVPENNSDDDLGSNSSEIYDKWENKIEEWYSTLEIRQTVYNEFYPFIVNNNTIILKEDLDYKNKLYIFLLLNSNLKYIENINLLTSDFEELSLEAFREYLPTTAKCYRFGKSMLDYDRYKGHITNKIDELAKDLKYNIKYEAHYFSNNDSGDGGLDLISWIPFTNDENQNNIQIYLGQCATGKEWHKKQDDTDKFVDNYINFRSNPSSVMFIPYDSRNSERKFDEEARMKHHLFFDRIRLLTLLENNKEIITKLKSFDEIINEIIRYEEDIV